MEKELIQKRFAKAQASYNDHAVAQQQIHQHLTNLLQQTGVGFFPRILEVGCGTGGFTRKLASYCEANEWLLNDLCVDPAFTADLFSEKSVHYLSGDAERQDFVGTFNLIASASALQWFTDPEAFVNRMSAQLAPGGILLFNTFGPKNLHEIKTITGKGLTYPTLPHVRTWVPESLDIITLTEEEITLTFRSPQQVLQHLKYTGVTATNAEGWTRGKLLRFCSEYLRLYTYLDQVIITYQPIYLLAVKRK